MTVPPEVNEFIDSFIGRSPQTKQNYESFTRIFWDFVGGKKAEDVTVDDVMSFLNNGLEKYKWKTSTLRQYATLCQIILGEFHDDKWKKQLRKKLRVLPKVQSHAALYEGNYVPPEKIDAFIAAAPDEEWGVLDTMILKWGLRLGEALRLSPSDVDVVKNRVIVRGKGLGGFGKVRQVLVEKFTVIRVLTYAGCTQEQLEGKKPIRDTSPIIKGIKERTAEIQWKSTAKKIGLKNWRKLTPHDGRHCLHGETRIVTPDGITKAQNLFFKNTAVLGLNLNNLTFQSAEVTAKNYHRTELLEIWANGREILCSPEHRFFTIGLSGIEEIRARELKEGVFVAGISHIDVVEREYYHPDFWQWLGYFIGDGSYPKRSTIITDKNVILLQKYANLLQSHKISAHISKKDPNVNSHSLILGWQPLVNLTSDLGLRVNSLERRAPTILNNAKKAEVGAFIAGYFDAEGFSTQDAERWCSANKELLKDVQMLLLRFGIQSRLQRRKRLVKLPQGRKIRHTMYELTIKTYRDRVRLRENIKPFKQYKDLVAIQRPIAQPLPINALFRPLFDKYRTKITKLDNRLIPRYYSAINPTLETTQRIFWLLQKAGATREELDPLERIINSDIHWLEVHKIKRYSPNNVTYDFTTSTETLITDGFITHNSMAIDFLIKRKKEGMPALVLLKNQLGHNNIQTTMIYLDLAGGEAQDVFDAGVQSSYKENSSSKSGVSA